MIQFEYIMGSMGLGWWWPLKASYICHVLIVDLREPDLSTSSENNTASAPPMPLNKPDSISGAAAFFLCAHPLTSSFCDWTTYIDAKAKNGDSRGLAEGQQQEQQCRGQLH